MKYCLEQEYLKKIIWKDLKIKKTIEEQLTTVQKWEDIEIKNMFDNLKILTHHETRDIKLNYADEYSMIIKLAMYTGARENEILQLTKQDVKEEDGILYIDINVQDKKKIKNISSIRRVPIHEDIRTDLLDHIQKIKTKKLFKISTINFAGKFSKFKAKLGYPKTTKVFHSFRHSLQNKLKQAGVEPMMIRELSGHSQSQENEMTDKYTDRYELKILKENIDKISFDV